eukprot:gene28943-35900_t
MALKSITNFNWEKALLRVGDNADVKRTINIVRNKANEVTAQSAKYSAAPEPVNFGAYKSKLRFTSSAVDVLEAAYNKRSLPVFTASVPDFETKQRQLQLASVKNLINSVQADLADLNAQVAVFEEIRIRENTSTDDLAQRFPQIAREIETEITNHEWLQTGK